MHETDPDHEAPPPAEGDAQATPSAAPLPRVDRWLVDGFNALHAVVLGGEDRESFWDGAHRERLIASLARGLEPAEEAASEGAPRIVLVFDGHRPAHGDAARPAPGLEVVFAPSADDWIVKQARASATRQPPLRIGIVSNDRKVVGRCRHAGTAVVSPAAFMLHLRRDPAPQSAE